MPSQQKPVHNKPFSPPMAALLEIARKYSRRADEAEDLVQDLLLEAVRTKRTISDEKFLPWAHGFLRNRAAFVARTEGRRRKREKVAKQQTETQNNKRLQFPDNFLQWLSPALGKTARLINCGLNKKEISYLLDVGDAALRQRFTALRKEWERYFEEHGAAPETHSKQESPLHTGLLRRALQNSFYGESSKIIGSFDPDGNLLVFREKPAHKKEPGGNNKNEREL